MDAQWNSWWKHTIWYPLRLADEKPILTQIQFKQKQRKRSFYCSLMKYIKVQLLRSQFQNSLRISIGPINNKSILCCMFSCVWNRTLQMTSAHTVARKCHNTKLSLMSNSQWKGYYNISIIIQSTSSMETKFLMESHFSTEVHSYVQYSSWSISTGKRSFHVKVAFHEMSRVSFAWLQLCCWNPFHCKHWYCRSAATGFI